MCICAGFFDAETQRKWSGPSAVNKRSLEHFFNRMVRIDRIYRIFKVIRYYLYCPKNPTHPVHPIQNYLYLCVSVSLRQKIPHVAQMNVIDL